MKPFTGPLFGFLLTLAPLVGWQGATAFNIEGSTAGPIKWPVTGTSALPTITVTYKYLDGNYEATMRPKVTKAFTAWSQGSMLILQNGGEAAGSPNVGDLDQINLIRFSTNTADDQALLAGSSSVTLLYTDDKNQILDADMLINPDAVAAQSIMHETGHFLGLAHSAVLGAMMYPLASSRSDDAKVVDWANTPTLDWDDRAAINALYPARAGDFGRISGKVVMESTLQPVYGANVVAVSASTGLVCGAALTKGANQGAGAGIYEIAGLQPGGYLVYAEPVDGPLSQADWPGNYAGGDYWGGMFTKHYKTSYYSGDPASAGIMKVSDNVIVTMVLVSAGQTTPNVNITVASDAADARLNLLYAAVTATSDNSVPAVPTLSLPVGVACGDSKRVYVYGKSGTSFTGCTLSVMNRGNSRVAISGVTSGTKSGADGKTYPYMRFDVAASAIYGDGDWTHRGSHIIEISKDILASGKLVRRDKVMYTGGLIVGPTKNQCRSWMGYE